MAMYIYIYNCILTLNNKNNKKEIILVYRIAVDRNASLVDEFTDLQALPTIRIQHNTRTIPIFEKLFELINDFSFYTTYNGFLPIWIQRKSVVRCVKRRLVEILTLVVAILARTIVCRNIDDLLIFFNKINRRFRRINSYSLTQSGSNSGR